MEVFPSHNPKSFSFWSFSLNTYVTVDGREWMIPNSARLRTKEAVREAEDAVLLTSTRVICDVTQSDGIVRLPVWLMPRQP